MEGWVKLHRELLDKPIWAKSTSQQKTILITLLMMANHKPNEWEWKGEKFEVKEGQFVTSIDSIKQRAGKDISTQNVRSALAKFEKYEFLTNKSTKMGRLITIVNWGLYQCCNEEGNKDANKEVTKRSQRTNKEVTSNKNVRMEECNKYKIIVEYLNEKAGKSFKHTTGKTKSCIDARVNEGFTVENFKKVIDVKTNEWKGSDMEKFLRPETLFSNKFEGYLNQYVAPKEEYIANYEEDEDVFN